LSRAMMRAQRGSSATDGRVEFRGSAGVEVMVAQLLL
jgi:hypothetical protein